jgi:hypothetical protein
MVRKYTPKSYNEALRAGGMKTEREERNTNCRLDCPLCPRKGLLFKSYGLHIIKEHTSLLFDASRNGNNNRKALFRKSLSKGDQPLILDVGETTTAWCLGCSSCFRCETKAEQHLRNKSACRTLQQENLNELRELYPLDGIPEPTPQTLKQKWRLEALISNLLERVRKAEKKDKLPDEDCFDYEGLYGRCFEDWGLNISEKTLQEEWDVEESEEEKKEPESEKEEEEQGQEQEEGPPLLLSDDKPLTQAEVAKLVLDETTIKELSTSVTTGQVVKVPELEKLLGSEPQPQPIFEKKEETILAEINAFRQMSPYERFKRANPDASTAELLVLVKQHSLPSMTPTHPTIIKSTTEKRKKKVVDLSYLEKVNTL